MSESKRRFFSGDTLQQALVQAANHYHLQPEEISYQPVEKRHGFTKVRRKVVIEIDPDAPRREVQAGAPVAPPEPPPANPGALAAPAAPGLADDAEEDVGTTPARATPAASAPPAASAAPAASAGRRPAGGNERRGGAAAHGGRGRSHGRPASPRETAGTAMERGPRSVGHGGAPRGGGLRRPSGAFPRERRYGDRGPAGAGNVGLEAEDLVALPETPRSIGERYPTAEGPQAEAAAKGIELLLRVAGLDLTPRICQGEERLEIELVGADTDWCFADDGELLMAMEHLLPRIIRSLSGEAVLCRVDCDNFHEIREERLRSLAQKVADEVRQRGRSRTLVPMNPADRRIIHVTLADDPAVVTESEGDGYFKRITVRPA
jgi:predicted RNA-binding protein Jag